MAQDISLDVRALNISAETLKAGYTVDEFDGKFRVGIFPEVLSEETQIVFKDFYDPEKILPIPKDKKIISHIYEFDIKNKDAFKDQKPLIIEMKYDSDYTGFKSIYYWNQINSTWVKVPSYNITGRKKMRADFHLPYARLAVFEDKNAMETGTASWYKWKNCDCAASPDYPKGTLLEVINLDNGKSVIVTVNDYGPERDKFPNRVIDLDKVAFEKIASPSLGLCDVRVKPFEKTEQTVTLISEKTEILGESIVSEKEAITPGFEINAKSVIVINNKTGEILYEKDSNKKLPVASITKLMTAKTVLDLKPDWNQVMTYIKADDDVMDYATKQEMSYLYVEPGETMTVKDLFFSSLLGSANNATYALYRSTGLLRRDFVEVMNRKAKELGMNDSNFTEPSGLDSRNISTAKDIAKLGRKVFNSFKVLEATTSKKYSFSTINTSEPHTIKTRNKLLYSDLYILGAKTGYLDEAGKCLMVRVKNEAGDEVIVVTLGNFSENKDDYFTETEKLAKWGLNHINI